MFYKHYKTKSGKNKGNLDRAVKISAVIFCVAITFMFASLICGNFFVSTGKSGNFIKITQREYYCISFGSYSSFSQAQKAAAALRARGGGGYIHNDGRYSVFAALYINSADADSVCTRLINSGCDCSVYVIKISACNYCYDKEKISYQVISESLSIFNTAIESLYSVFVEIDGKMITDSDAKARLEGLKREISRRKAAFDTAATDLNSHQYLRLKEALASLEINAGIISDASFITENTAVEIKYYMLKIALSYQSFVNDIRGL